MPTRFEVIESPDHFSKRKMDHLRVALDQRVQGQAEWSRLNLNHEALPELDFKDVSLSTRSLKKETSSPFFVSSMTAGHQAGFEINRNLSLAAEARGWRMGVGSQRRQIGDPEAKAEWKQLRSLAPKVRWLGNLGLSQLIQSGSDAVLGLAESLGAEAFIIHINPLQECLQTEGTPFFRGGYEALTKLVQRLPIPLIVKEVGCGFSPLTLKRLEETGVSAVDLAGAGGTHWGRVEGLRSDPASMEARIAPAFWDWGWGLIEALIEARKLELSFEIWASGGVRSGVDAAKALALGATSVGLAKPLLDAAMKNAEAVESVMEQLEAELRVALFCTGSENPKAALGKVRFIDGSGKA